MNCSDASRWEGCNPKAAAAREERGFVAWRVRECGAWGLEGTSEDEERERVKRMIELQKNV